MSRFLLPLLIVAMCHAARAVTITAASTSQPDVQAAVNLAHDGDVVQVPAGSSIWTTNVTVQELGIQLLGSGTNNTIITDENPSGSRPCLFLITWSQTNTGNVFKLSGWQFKTSTNVVRNNALGMIQMNGSDNETNNSAWRICSNYWNLNGVNTRPIQIRAWSGLFDHNYIKQDGSSGISIDCRINANEKGDRSWANPVLIGTTNEGVYIEDCTFTRATTKSATDAFAGARYVIRFCSTTNAAFENHGTESTQRARGGRWIDGYGNIMTHTASGGEYAFHSRSGTAVICSNTLVGNWPGLWRSVYDLSTDGNQPWRQADGTNVWDVNLTAPGSPYITGTHTGTNGSLVLEDNTKSWTNNALLGFSVQNSDRFNTNGAWVGHQAGLIDGNGATNITTKLPAKGLASIYLLRWDFGNHYGVFKVGTALDAAGSGQGDLLVGGGDQVPPTPTTWPNQIRDPIYAWANIGGITNMTAGNYPVVAGRDYISGVARPGFTTLVYPHPLQGFTNAAPPPPPAAPSALAVAVIGSTELDLTWTDNSSDEEGFSVERSPTGGGAGFTQIATVGAGVTAYPDTGLNASTTYFYRVRAFNAGGNSAYTSEASGTTRSVVLPYPVKGRRLGLQPQFPGR